jgi:hypothetical protein
MSKRVTDLEKFALEEVWRPYQTLMGYEKRLERLPVSLEETAKLLVVDETGWSKCVLDRIAAIGFTFPSYVQHTLVRVIQAAQRVRKSAGRQALEERKGRGSARVNSGDNGDG